VMTTPGAGARRERLTGSSTGRPRAAAARARAPKMDVASILALGFRLFRDGLGEWD
jgi:hypothetical protein